MKSLKIVTLVAAASILGATVAEAACVNKYVHRRDGRGRVALTLVTGKLTFAEAQKLVADVEAKRASIVWTDASGKSIVEALPGASAERPMPVACDGRTSGSVLSVSFLRPTAPSGAIHLKFGDGEVVRFEEQN